MMTKNHPPALKNSFLMMICQALDMTPYELARRIAVHPDEIAGLIKGRAGELIEIDVDPVWHAIADYVDRHIAGCLAVREELNRKLQRDRQKRQQRFLEMGGF